MLLKLTFSSKAQHPCGRVTWWHYTQSLCHLSVPHLDDVDAICCRHNGNSCPPTDRLKTWLHKNSENTAFSNQRNIYIQTLESFIWQTFKSVAFFSPRRRPGNPAIMEVWLESVSCDFMAESKGTPNDYPALVQGQWCGVFVNPMLIPSIFGRIFLGNFVPRGV